MTRHWILLTVAAFWAALFALVGCGGSSSGGGGGAGGGLVAFYATDSLNNMDHVWVKVYKITVNSASGSQVAFDDPAGNVVDLRALRDAQGGKFLFLSLTKITGGPFTSATVQMDKNLTVVPAGATAGVAKQFDDKFDDSTGKTSVTFSFSKAKGLGVSDDSLIIDFDLAHWDDIAGKITPVIKGQDDKGGLGDERRHVEDDMEGTVSGLTGAAPDQEFNLVTGGGRSVHVKTDSNTVVFNSDNKPNPALANGQRVQVRGKFIVAAGSVLAVAIKIESAGMGHDLAEAKGVPKAIDSVAGTFDVDIVRADHFIPQGSIVKIVTTDTTVYRSEAGVSLTKQEFFDTLAHSGAVEVEGSFDTSTNTITAARCKLDDTAGGGGGGGGLGEAEAKGSVSDLNEAAGSFTLTLTNWEGFSGTMGQKLTVTLTATAKFKDKSGNLVDKATFFAGLGQFGFAEVKGSFDNDVFKADFAKVDDN